MSFSIRHDAAPLELNVRTDAILAPTDWTPVTAEFDAPGGGGMVSVRVVRRASLKFDKMVKGDVRIDHVAITAASERSRP